MYAVLASVALLATAVAGQGSAIVINSCDYDVTLSNVPSSGGGQSEVGPNQLAPGGTYSQVYTQLTNGNGWSIKLAQNAGDSNILQFEYTYGNDGTIWYDLSEVNGNPWDGDWEITATGSCTPRQAAYRFATDDAYGEQSCPDSSSVTVTLCSGTGSGSSGSGSGLPIPSGVPSGVPSVPGLSDASTPSTPSPSPTSSPWQQNAAAAPSNAEALDTPSPAAGGNTVTNIVTEVVTMYVTPSPVAGSKRHERHARHLAHHRRH